MKLVTKADTMEINLAGQWAFAFGQKDAIPTHWTDNIILPGTTETAGRGEFSLDATQTEYLARTRPFTGVAWYQRTVEIPPNWQGRRVMLFLERTKHTRIWVDGKPAASSTETILPQIHELTAALTPGRHIFTIAVDNDLAAKPDFPAGLLGGHQYTEHTQTNWNGIIGRICLYASGQASITACRAVGRTADGELDVSLWLHSTAEYNTAQLRVFAQCVQENRRHTLTEMLLFPDIPSGESEFRFSYTVGEPMLWDEFHPVFYRLHCVLEADGQTVCEHVVQCGFADAEVRQKRLVLHGVPLSLRGTVDCAIFPRTAACPTTLSEWMHVLGIIKEYGMNHYRFHSWCPPEAAFDAADRLGLYLQVELPCFGNGFYQEGHPKHDPVLNRFLYDQSLKVIRQYGNHPSFFIFAVGNEMVGDLDEFRNIVYKCREYRNDIVYTQGANNFFTDPNPPCIQEDDCWIVMRTDKTHNIRGSFSHPDAPLGHIQSDEQPSAMVDYSDALEQSLLPLIAHEVGQFQVFPNLKERADYTGPLYPTVLDQVERRLAHTDQLPQAEAYRRASGELAVQCYREEIEALLRTPEMTGFQLLGLQDFPGQGTALVGVLDSFFRSKGLITPENWRRFCSDQILLARFGRYTYFSMEQLCVEVVIYNYGREDLTGNVTVDLLDGQNTLDTRVIDAVSAGRGTLTTAGSVRVDLPGIRQARALRLRLRYGQLINEYPVWVYPTVQPKVSAKVRVTEVYTPQVEQMLMDGETVVLFSSDASEQYSVEGFFPTDFWCYPMFEKSSIEKDMPVAPGTMGLLIDAQHDALAGFPTLDHAQWQWHALARYARPVILDEFAHEIKPVVQVIDNFSRCHRMALLFEVAVGKGRLIVSASDVLGHWDMPEVRQYYTSILAYAAAAPAATLAELSSEQLRRIFPA